MPPNTAGHLKRLQEFAQQNAVNDNTGNVWINPNWQPQPHPNVCPGCGHCQHCGRYVGRPQNPWEPTIFC